MGDAHVGLQARLMSQALRKLTGTLSKSKTILVFINQIRMKIGVMFGNPETTTGGNALKFYASIRIEVRRIETIERGDDDAVGNKVRVKVVKNKVAPPFRRVELEIMFGKGLSASGSLIDAAVKCNIVDKKGAWYTYGEEKLGQGRENVKITLEQNPELAAELEAKVRKIFFPPKDAAADTSTALPRVGVNTSAASSTASSTSPGTGSRAATKASTAGVSGPAENGIPSGEPAKQASKAATRPPAIPADDDDGGLF